MCESEIHSKVANLGNEPNKAVKNEYPPFCGKCFTHHKPNQPCLDLNMKVMDKLINALSSVSDPDPNDIYIEACDGE